ncbi:SprT family zinc-dependent metalloprotease [Thorsellia anophelis]|uniref:SprT protein n=1 Tax=Thorsellia anophelis DSM 18579 TaxID=1123402 RepID=A0A1I0E1E0_9GAMM|nr:SprT family zinc-dependent metalloprotease [Thorsellia anophelis]SET38694.1 SprT protein [Thorsellia anophelis DSM 18579]
MKLSLDELIEIANNKLSQSLELSNKVLGVNYPMPLIEYDLRGRAAGLAYPQEWKIRINRLMMSENSIAFIDEVIPHELAHLIVYRYFIRDLKKKNIKPHGLEWQEVMHKIFNLPSKRTHNYEVPKRKVKTFTYICGCNEFSLTAVRHNKVEENKANYICNKCKQPLKYTGEMALKVR